MHMWVWYIHENLPIYWIVEAVNGTESEDTQLEASEDEDCCSPGWISDNPDQTLSDEGKFSVQGWQFS